MLYITLVVNIVAMGALIAGILMHSGRGGGLSDMFGGGGGAALGSTAAERNLNRITDRIQKSIVRNFSAKAAVEIAVYDLFGQLYEAPIYRLLGGGDAVITTDITISVDYIDKMVEDARAAVEAGFETLKVKVGKDPALDIERIKAIHAAVGDRALIRLDANQGWTPKQAVAAAAVGEVLGRRRLVSFDMGGTSTDVALIEGEIVERTYARNVYESILRRRRDPAGRA